MSGGDRVSSPSNLDMESAHPLEQIHEPPQPAPRLSIGRLCGGVSPGTGSVALSKSRRSSIRLTPFVRGDLLACEVEIERSGPDMLGEPGRKEEPRPSSERAADPGQLIERPSRRDERPDQDGPGWAGLLRLPVQQAPERDERGVVLERPNRVSERREARAG